MKHFLLEGEHIVPFEQRAPELIAAHRQYLQQGYDNGRFLLVNRRSNLGLTHMWNGPTGKVFVEV